MATIPGFADPIDPEPNELPVEPDTGNETPADAEAPPMKAGAVSVE